MGETLLVEALNRLPCSSARACNVYKEYEKERQKKERREEEQ